jgi:hypothetical protein
MPWPEPQRRAIFLNTKRKKGEKAARDLMHKHGHISDRRKKITRALRSQ